jgi:SAM-dependent methyltransferase
MSRLHAVFAAAEELNYRTILAALEPVPGGTLVDLGCGAGTFTQRLGERARPRRLIGVELIDHLADAAQARGIEVVRSDLGEPLPFADASIDAVHSNQVIEHLPRTDGFMREIARVLKPGGYAVVSTNNLASAHNIVSLLAGWQPMPCHVSDEVVGLGNPVNPHQGEPGAAAQMHLRLFTGRALAELATHHGLRVELAVTDGFYPLGPRAARLATRLLPRHGAFLVQRYRR